AITTNSSISVKPTRRGAFRDPVMAPPMKDGTIKRIRDDTGEWDYSNPDLNRYNVAISLFMETSRVRHRFVAALLYEGGFLWNWGNLLVELMFSPETNPGSCDAFINLNQLPGESVPAEFAEDGAATIGTEPVAKDLVQGQPLQGRGQGGGVSG